MKFKFTTASPLPAAVWLSAEWDSTSYLLPPVLHFSRFPHPCHYTARPHAGTGKWSADRENSAGYLKNYYLSVPFQTLNGSVCVYLASTSHQSRRLCSPAGGSWRLLLCFRRHLGWFKAADDTCSSHSSTRISRRHIFLAPARRCLSGGLLWTFAWRFPGGTA